MTMRALVAAGGVAVLAGCGGDTPNPTPGESFEYGTHCGVGATSIDGTTYYPTAVYDGDEPITGSDPSWYTSAGGPTPWITVEGDQIRNLFAMTPYFWKTPHVGALRLAAKQSLTTEIGFRFLAYRRV